MVKDSYAFEDVMSKLRPLHKTGEKWTGHGDFDLKLFIKNEQVIAVKMQKGIAINLDEARS